MGGIILYLGRLLRYKRDFGGDIVSISWLEVV